MKKTEAVSTTEVRHWVWIRGLARHSAHWYNFEASFRKKFPNDIIEKIDTRGNGDQAHAPSFLTIEDNVRDLRARSTLAQKGPVHLLTISLGSMIGIEWANLFPEEIASLTIINVSDARHSRTYDRLRPRNFKKILEILSHPFDNFAVEMKLMEMIAQNVEDKEKVARDFANTPPTSLGNLTRQLVAASQFKVPTEAPHLPLLILGGRNDGFVNPACSERIAQAWHMRVVWHDTAGHDIPLEFPDWVAEQMDYFLN